MSAQPALQTSTTVNPIDISQTEDATHVYVKVANPKSLCPKFEGPFAIESRPSRSQVRVRIGSYANGEPRLLTLHWSSCKIAHLRDKSAEASRNPLGRPKTATATPDSPTSPEAQFKLTAKNDSTISNAGKQAAGANVNKAAGTASSTGDADGAQIQTRLRPLRTTRNQNPNYISYIASPA